MTNKEIVLEVMRAMGMQEAQSLRTKAADMTATEIIDMERAIPAWSHDKDYTSAPTGTPVYSGGQVYGLIQPHNAANYEGTPATLRALWSLLHTKNPLRAKAWVTPEGTSGMYMTDECYLGEDGHVYRCKQDNCVWSYEDLETAWDDLGLLDDLKNGITTPPEEPSTEPGTETEPGTGTDTDSWPVYVQPTGAQDAYHTGDKVTWNDKHYTCIAPDGVACVWDPDTYPSYWQLEE